MRIAENFPTDGTDYRKSRLISEIREFNHLVESDILLVVSGGKQVVAWLS